jgi:hypothetical protein
MWRYLGSVLMDCCRHLVVNTNGGRCKAIMRHLMRQVDRILYPWLWERKHQWIIVLDNLSTEGAEFLWELLQPVASSGMLQSRAQMHFFHSHTGARFRALSLCCAVVLFLD